MPLTYRLRDERGVILPLAGLLVFGLIAFVALTVDVGALSLDKRELRSAADLASLDATEALRQGGTLADMDSAATAIAVESFQRNGHEAANLVDVEIGTYEPGTGFTACTGDPCVADAVRVVATAAVPRYFAFWASGSDIEVDAVAQLEELVGFQLGSFLARFNSANSSLYNEVIGAQLGAPVSVTGVGYEGLADTYVTYEDLAAAFGFASPSEMAEASVSYGDVLDASETILSNDPTAPNEARDAVAELKAAYAAAPPEVKNDFPVKRLGVGDGRAAHTRVNLFGVIMAGAQAADGSSGFSTSLSTLPLGLASGTLRAGAVQAPVRNELSIAAWQQPGAALQTAQVRYRFDMTVTQDLVDTVNGLLGLLGGGLSTSDVITIFVRSGAATGAPTALLECPETGIPHPLAVVEARVQGSAFESTSKLYALGLGSGGTGGIDQQVDQALADAGNSGTLATPPIAAYDQTGTYDLLNPPVHPQWPAVTPPEWSEETYLEYGNSSLDPSNGVVASLTGMGTLGSTLQQTLATLNSTDLDGNGRGDLDDLLFDIDNALGIYSGGADGAVYFVDCDTQVLVE